MTAHKHAELIKAKADNMGLVVFVKASAHGGKWFKIDWCDFPTNPHQEYFMCHPKHAKECLHWLNGGEVYLVSEYNEDRQTVIEKDVYGAWNKGSCFMNESYEFRIKPRKEKRWIVVKNGMLQSNHLFECDNEAAVVCGFGGQFIEIEVEV